jgi:hypothetical protein
MNSMTTGTSEQEISLSEVEYQYLKNSQFVDQASLSNAKFVRSFGSNSWQLKLPTQQIVQLGDQLTEQLAKTGYDQEYGLTIEGKILDEMIDKLRVTFVATQD